MFKIEIHKGCNSVDNPVDVTVAVNCFGQPALFETLDDAIQYNYQAVRPCLTEYDGVEIVDTNTQEPVAFLGDTRDNVEDVPKFLREVKQTKGQASFQITHFRGV